MLDTIDLYRVVRANSLSRSLRGGWNANSGGRGSVESGRRAARWIMGTRSSSSRQKWGTHSGAAMATGEVGSLVAAATTVRSLARGGGVEGGSMMAH